MTTRILPKTVRDRALWAIGHLEAWNSAILQARTMERLTKQPGRYEFDLRTGRTDEQLDAMRNQATIMLDNLELVARKQGWSLAEFYAAIGTLRPPLEPEGPQVHTWFQGQR